MLLSSCRTLKNSYQLRCSHTHWQGWGKMKLCLLNSVICFTWISVFIHSVHVHVTANGIHLKWKSPHVTWQTAYCASYFKPSQLSTAEVHRKSPRRRPGRIFQERFPSTFWLKLNESVQECTSHDVESKHNRVRQNQLPGSNRSSAPPPWRSPTDPGRAPTGPWTDQVLKDDGVGWSADWTVTMIPAGSKFSAWVCSAEGTSCFIYLFLHLISPLILWCFSCGKWKTNLSITPN